MQKTPRKGGWTERWNIIIRVARHGMNISLIRQSKCAYCAVPPKRMREMNPKQNCVLSVNTPFLPPFLIHLLVLSIGIRP